MPGLTYNARVVQLDHAQPEGDPNAPIPKFDPYRRKHVDAAHWPWQDKIYRIASTARADKRETGVPEEVMLAIYGHETNYGPVTGNYNAPQALASLAFEGRRRPLFEGE